MNRTITDIDIVSYEGFDKWVDEMNKDFTNNESKFPNIQVMFNSFHNKKQCVLIDWKENKVYRTQYGDRSSRWGLAITWAKFRNYSIPKMGEKTGITQLKFGQRFYDFVTKHEYKYLGLYDLNKHLVLTSSGKIICIYQGCNDYPVYVKPPKRKSVSD